MNLEGDWKETRRLQRERRQAEAGAAELTEAVEEREEERATASELVEVMEWARDEILRLERLLAEEARVKVRTDAIHVALARAQKSKTEGDRLSKLEQAKAALRRFVNRAPMEPKANGHKVEAPHE